MSVFIESQPEFYEKTFDWRNWNDEITGMKPHEALCITSKGFEVVGRVWQIVYRILGFFGFERPTNIIRVEYELLKFLRHRHHHFQTLYRGDLVPMIKKLRQQHGYESPKQDYLDQIDKNLDNGEFLKKALQEYHKRFKTHLQPSIYRRCIAPRIYLGDQADTFGGTYLALANQLYHPFHTDITAINEQRIMRIVHCFIQATKCYNKDRKYQEEFLRSLNVFSYKVMAHFTEKNGFKKDAVERVTKAVSHIYSLGFVHIVRECKFFDLAMEKSKNMPEQLKEAVKSIISEAEAMEKSKNMPEQLKEAVKSIISEAEAPAPGSGT